MGSNITDGNTTLGLTPEHVLAQVFNNADVDKNGLLDLPELQTWINAKVRKIHPFLVLRARILVFDYINI